MAVEIPASFTVTPLQQPLTADDRARAPMRFAWLYVVAALAICASYVFEGPVRYVLLLAHVPTLIYVRDLAALALIGLAVSFWLGGERRLFPLMVAIYALGLHVLCGALLLPSLAQPLLGLKVFFTFLFGMAASVAVADRSRELLWVALIAFAASAAGVALDVVVNFPWAGQAYESAIATVQVSREWSSGGIARLSGFARASFDAATIMLVLIVPILASPWSVLWRATLWFVAAGTIWLTTTKGALLALIALAVWRALESLRSARRLVLAWIAGFAGVCLALPIVSTQFGFGVRRNDVAGWLGSFVERMDFMWPDALATWLDQGNIVTGRGLGGIGFAQAGAEWWRYNAADNLMIYLLVSFGLFALVYVGAFLWGLRRTFEVEASQEFLARCIRGWALVLFSYGCTSNMVEQPLMNFVVGVCFGAMTMVFVGARESSAVAAVPTGVK